MSTEIATVEPAEVEIESLSMREAARSKGHYAKVYGIVNQMVESGALPKSITNPIQAMIIIEHGQDYGMTAIQALNSIEMVQGGPRIKAAALANLIKRQYGDEAFQVIEWDATVCTISVNRTRHDGSQVPDVSFTIEEAKAAGLLKNNVWAKFPKNMLFAKALRDMWKGHFQGLGNGVIELAELAPEVTSKPAPRTLGDL